MQHRDVGEIETLEVTAYDDNGDAVEPTTITLTINPPVGGAPIVKHKADLTNDGNDTFTFDLALTAAGAWTGTFVTTSPPLTESFLFVVGEQPYDGPFEPWCTWDEVLRHPALQTLSSLYQSIVDDFNVRERESIVDAASEVMFNLSGRIYPGYKLVRRMFPRCQQCGAWWWAPYWYGYHLCGCPNPTGMRISHRYPVIAVVKVVLNDVELDPTEYVMHGSWLERADGAVWPKADELTSVRGFVIDYVVGAAIPEAGRRSARELIALDVSGAIVAAGAACAGENDNSDVTSIVREGITFRLNDAASMIAAGSTGFSRADLWLRSLKEGRRATPGMFDASRSARCR